MRTRSFILAAVAACAIGLTCAAAAAADVYVIANDSLRMTPAELREVFLGERQFAGGRRLVPLDNASLQKDFVNRVIGIEPAKYNTVWAKKGFREGLNPPDVMAGDQEVIAAVKATLGAVGYVSRVPVGVQLIDKY